MNDDAHPQIAHVVSFVDEHPGAGAVHIKTALDDIGRDRLRRESEVLSSLSHPNVVEIVASSPGNLTTRLAGRRTLAELGPRSIDDVASIARALLQTLDDLHAAGWTHGAIHASHVVVGPLGRLTLCSWRRAMPRPLNHPAFHEDRAAMRVLVETLAATALPSSMRQDHRARGQLAEVLRALQPSAGPRSPTPPALPTARVASIATVAGPLFASLVSGALAWFLANGMADMTTDAPTAIALSSGVLRWMAVCAAGYLAVVSLILAMARAVDATRVAMLALSALPSPLRRALTGVIGAGLLSMAAPRLGVTPPRTADTPTATVPTPTLEDAKVQSTTSTPNTTTSTMPTTVSITPPVETDVTSPPEVTTPVLAPLPTPGAGTPESRVHVIQPGEHLWSIAAQTTHERLGRVASEREIARYWNVLVAANRSMLIDPANPDLVVAGQAITLPD